MTGTASLTVRRAENRIWGLQVFLEATGDPKLDEAASRADWGFRVTKLRLTRELRR